MNDWIGNARSIYTTLGASNHTEGERELHDFYATHPRAMELLLDMEQFSPNIWECACGTGHLSEVLKQRGYNVYSTDSRLICAKNGDFESISSSAVAYAWYVWEKGYTGDTVLKWFN